MSSMADTHLDDTTSAADGDQPDETGDREGQEGQGPEQPGRGSPRGGAGAGHGVTGRRPTGGSGWSCLAADRACRRISTAKTTSQTLQAM